VVLTVAPAPHRPSGRDRTGARKASWDVGTVRAAVWTLGLYPLVLVAWWLRDGLFGLGANPIERVLHHTGWWALLLLLTTLAVTPLRKLTGLNQLARARRPLGLFAFFYATLHLIIYVGLDQVFAWAYIVEDVTKRPFITVGVVAWSILLPLAVTSTRAWVRRLGKRWVALHRLIYLAAPLGILHYFWKVRADTRMPLLFAAAFALLMLLRLRPTSTSSFGRRRRQGRWIG
jgi:methionine sulfoxide reductase heme-binding subunit